MLVVISSFVPYGDDECVEHMEGSKAECDQTKLLPAQHPAIQPVWEAPRAEHVFIITTS